MADNEQRQWEAREALEARARAANRASAVTLRDRFAMAALTGLCADPNSGHDDRSTVEQMATWCYDIADAMLASRGKR